MQWARLVQHMVFPFLPLSPILSQLSVALLQLPPLQLVEPVKQSTVKRCQKESGALWNRETDEGSVSSELLFVEHSELITVFFEEYLALLRNLHTTAHGLFHLECTYFILLKQMTDTFPPKTVVYFSPPDESQPTRQRHCLASGHTIA